MLYFQKAVTFNCIKEFASHVLLQPLGEAAGWVWKAWPFILNRGGHPSSFDIPQTSPGCGPQVSSPCQHFVASLYIVEGENINQVWSWEWSCSKFKTALRKIVLWHTAPLVYFGSSMVFSCLPDIGLLGSWLKDPCKTNRFLSQTVKDSLSIK